MGKYAKTVVAVVAAALAVLTVVLDDGKITGAEWVQVALAGLGALGVYAIPNKPKSPQ